LTSNANITLKNEQALMQFTERKLELIEEELNKRNILIIMKDGKLSFKEKPDEES
jgi:hypothetical protein